MGIRPGHDVSARERLLVPSSSKSDPWAIAVKYESDHWEHHELTAPQHDLINRVWRAYWTEWDEAKLKENDPIYDDVRRELSTDLGTYPLHIHRPIERTFLGQLLEPARVLGVAFPGHFHVVTHPGTGRNGVGATQSVNLLIPLEQLIRLKLLRTADPVAYQQWLKHETGHLRSRLRGEQKTEAQITNEYPVDRYIQAYANLDARINGWSTVPAVGPTQAPTHHQASAIRWPMQNAQITFTRYVGAVHIGTLKQDQGYGTAVVLEVPLNRFQELAVLGEQTARAIQEKGHPLNIVYTLTEDGQSIRAYYFDTNGSASDAEVAAIADALSTPASVFWSQESVYQLGLLVAATDPDNIGWAIDALFEAALKWKSRTWQSLDPSPEVQNIWLHAYESTTVERRGYILTRWMAWGYDTPLVRALVADMLRNWTENPAHAAIVLTAISSAVENIASAEELHYYLELCSRILLDGPPEAIEGVVPLLQALTGNYSRAGEVLHILRSEPSWASGLQTAKSILREAFSVRVATILARLVGEAEPAILDMNNLEERAFSFTADRSVGPRLNAQAIDALHEAIRNAPSPREFLRKFFVQGAKIIFVSHGAGIENPIRAFRDFAALPVAHLALTLRPSEAEDFELFLKGIPNEAFLPRLAQALGILRLWERHDGKFDNALLEFRSVLNGMKNAGVTFVFFDASGEFHGEAAHRVEVSILEKAVRAGGKTIVYGDFIDKNFARIPLRVGGILETSLAYTLATRLKPWSGTQSPVVSIRQDNEKIWHLEAMLRVHNLNELLTAHPIARSFGIKPQGTELENLHFDSSCTTTYGESWDGMIYYAASDDGGDTNAIGPWSGSPEFADQDTPHVGDLIGVGTGWHGGFGRGSGRAILTQS